MEVGQRRSLAGRSRVCYNCLKEGHNAHECDSSRRCRTCNRKHHSLLHPAGDRKRSASSAFEEPKEKRSRPADGVSSSSSHPGSSA